MILEALGIADSLIGMSRTVPQLRSSGKSVDEITDTLMRGLHLREFRRFNLRKEIERRVVLLDRWDPPLQAES